MEDKIYEVRVIPFVRYEKRIKNGKVIEDAVDTFTREERANLSVQIPSMLWQNKDHIYLAEPPLVFNEGTGVRGTLYYMFDKLTPQEQEKYFNRSIVIRMTRPAEVQVYGEESKRFFGKTRSKNR